MATFLSLCADLARESGAIGAAPAAVTGQTGRQAKAVAWIADAWTQIQNERRHEWLFLREEEEATLVPGTSRYTATALGITSFADWRTTINPSLYPSGAKNEETELDWSDYDRWRRVYDFGTHDAGKPVYCAVSPKRELCLGPKPDAAYILRVEYQRAPQVLTANADVPLCPSEFHQIIVHRAHMMLCAHDEAWNAYKGAEVRYQAMLRDLLNDQTPVPSARGNALS